MKIRNKQSRKEGYSSTFNTHACSEIIVCYPDGDMDSGFITDHEAYIESRQVWMDMQDAFREKLIIPDNYNTGFREPANEAERGKGWY